MHKDKPPGIFDLGERSMRYAAGFCFVVGLVISLLVRIGIALAGEHFSQATPWSGS
jgi:membrane-associated PAP2 superfamily phosphatase